MFVFVLEQSLQVLRHLLNPELTEILGRKGRRDVNFYD